MVIVTGDRYLDSLVRFVERNAEPLLEGSLTLKLNPVGLHYVQSRLEALEELERLLSGAPVDYLRTYVSDLGDHRALEQLRRILQLLTSLKVISVLAPPSRDPTPLSLLPFGRLKVLELRGCDLSSSTTKGLLDLRHTLEKLICHNSTDYIVLLTLNRESNFNAYLAHDALRHVFASRLVDIKDSPAWNRLSFVSCACNGLVVMDESLQLLPAVEMLDLSRNHFAKLDNLRKCIRLSHLDLGFNHLRTVASLSEVPCPIVRLVLRNNALTTLRGIENLRSVEELDLSYNLLSTFSELEILASLPSLHSVWLEGNPICCARWYRGHFFSLFSCPEKIKLDEKGISRREYWERRVIIAGRRKRPAGYGFYFPAKENADDRDMVSSGKRKTSRLASIQDEEQKRSCPEDVHHESASYDTDDHDENGVMDDETEIKCLMDRVECMKKEQAVLWLRDFREWLDQTVDNASHSGTIGESNIMLPIKDTSKASNSDDFVEEDHLVQPVGGRMGSKVDDPSFNGLTVEVNRDKERMNDLTSLTTIEEIIFSRQSSLCPISPPHYKEDVLHRRHNMEEKFLQLSADTFSAASSDSGSSSGDDDSCESVDSCLEHSQLFNKASMKRIVVQQVSNHVTSNHDSMIDPSLKDRRKGKWKVNEWAHHFLSLGNSNSLQDSLEDRERMRLNHTICFGNASPKAKSNSLQNRDVQIERYFSTNLADSKVSESYQELTCCEWISEEGSGFREREVAVLLSSIQKVYVLLIDDKHEARGMISKVIGCYEHEEIKEVMIGLESQALRVRVENDVSHLFLTRSEKKLERLVSLFQTWPLIGWEGVQVELFYKYICGGIKMSIFLYAMLLLHNDDAEGESWHSRSLFLVEGYLFLCTENLADFGKPLDDFDASNPYFSLHSCWPIGAIREMVIEAGETRCLTLTPDQAMLGKNSFHHHHHHHHHLSHDLPSPWRLRWSSQEALLSFVALLEALHAKFATSPLHVAFSTSR